MLELLIVILFIWLAVKVVGFLLGLAWGTAKILGSVLFVLAVPALFLCLLFAGGKGDIIAVAVLGIQFGGSGVTVVTFE